MLPQKETRETLYAMHRAGFLVLLVRCFGPFRVQGFSSRRMHGLDSWCLLVRCFGPFTVQAWILEGCIALDTWCCW